MAHRRPDLVTASGAAGSFGHRIRDARRAGTLVVQPRMGFSDPGLMRRGLLATKAAAATTVGTITLDSYTRVRDFAAAARSLRSGTPLNGYPIVTHGPATTREVLDGVVDARFAMQVRHGAAQPGEIISTLVACGIDATEGGPVSYCLPYSRLPLAESVRSWRAACRRFADLSAGQPHLESFGGCMLGQLCPPSLLIALTVLEAMFFRRCGVHDVSVSFAQQSNARQDLAALAALRRLASEFLGPDGWHVVVYAYMGLFPTTAHGARALLADAATLAVTSGAERLIVKSAAEAHRIPTIAENVAAIEWAASVARTAAGDPAPPAPPDDQVYREARRLLETTLDLDGDLGLAFVTAFARGYLDVPYSLHPDSARRARSALLADGTIVWSSVGSMPLHDVAEVRPQAAMTSAELLRALSHVRNRYDASGTRGPA